MKMEMQTNRFKDLTKKEKIMVFAAVGAIIAFLYISLVIDPMLNSITPLKEQINELDLQVSDIGNIDRIIADLNEAYEVKKKNYEKASTVLPKSDRYPQLMRKLNEDLQACSLNLTSISNSEGITYVEKKDNNSTEQPTNEASSDLKTGLNSQSVTLNIEGDYNNILLFVDKLERGERICTVNTVTISGNAGKVVGNIMVTYFYGVGGEDENYNFNNGAYGNNSAF